MPPDCSGRCGCPALPTVSEDRLFLNRVCVGPGVEGDLSGQHETACTGNCIDLSGDRGVEVKLVCAGHGYEKGLFPGVTLSMQGCREFLRLISENPG